MSHDQAFFLFTVGSILVFLGALQGMTGRSTMSKTSFFGPAPRWQGWLVAAVGGIPTVVGAVALWLQS